MRFDYAELTTDAISGLQAGLRNSLKRKGDNEFDHQTTGCLRCSAEGGGVCSQAFIG